MLSRKLGDQSAVTRARKRLRRTVFGWGPAALWAAVLFLLSAWEEPSGIGLLDLPDEVLHIGIYSVFGMTLWWARHYRHPTATPAWFWGSGWVYGISDEWHQTFVAGRDAAFGDVVSDWIGVLLGFGAMVLVERKLRRMAKRREPTSDKE